MAALTCLRSVETNFTLTCPSPKSFVCNLPDSGRHVTSVFQGLSLSRSVGRVGENPGNEVVMPSGNSCTGILPRRQNHFGCARNSGNENKNRPLRNFFNSFMRSAFRSSVWEDVFVWNFALRQWLPICRQIFSSPRAVFPFRLLYSFLTYWFLYCGATLPRLYQRGEKNNSSKTSLCIYFHYTI